ncbi:hypothetical protein TDB9533_04423 [Thalassocella blandensis]|nr:hypothetical protein TDB9533_04423 [Thalassocella blandensis]
MSLIWQEHKKVNPFEAAVGDLTERVVFLAECNEINDDPVKLAISECIDKSVELLYKNITDTSLYYLCEWDVVYSMLTIVVTDEPKENDSQYVVKCCFNALDVKFQEIQSSSEDNWEATVSQYADNLRSWIKDYLTTCPGFMNYSLVAAFHSEDRSASKIL